MAKIVAKAIFYASIQSSLASVEMSSKFSVINFSKDQETLQRAADALRSYVMIAIVWTIGTVLALFATNGWCGGWIGLTANLVMIGWTVVSYMKAFQEAAQRYNLQYPNVFSKTDVIIGVVIIVVLLALMFMYGSFPKVF